MIWDDRARGEERDREDALPAYRLALEESRNAFSDLMAQPEKIRRNVGALLGFGAIDVSIFGFAAGRPTGISAGSSRLERCSLSWAWSSVRRTSRCHEN